MYKFVYKFEEDWQALQGWTLGLFKDSTIQEDNFIQYTFSQVSCPILWPLQSFRKDWQYGQ